MMLRLFTHPLANAAVRGLRVTPTGAAAPLSIAGRAPAFAREGMSMGPGLTTEGRP